MRAFLLAVMLAATATLVLAAQVALADVTVITYPIPSGAQPEGITLGPDGNLWFAEASSNKIGVMDKTGTVLQEYVVDAAPGEVDLHNLATGADGNVWVTEGDGRVRTGCPDSFTGCGRIDRLTPTGTVTRFDAPLAKLGSCASPCAAEPEQIVAGPDGNLWFTESAGSRIGRVTTAGVFKMFSTGLTGDVKGIGVGSDGNLWFTAPDDQKIGRITPTGTVTTFSSGTAAQEPIFGIAAGPDGAMYFGEPRGIGRITTAGVVTDHFPLPNATSNCEVHSVVPGPGNFLYFTEVDCNKAGRMSVTGVYTEYPLPTSDRSTEPFGMTVGPNGNIWFTDTNAHYVGTLVRSASSVTLTSSKNPSVLGDSVTFTATVKGVGSAQPSGKVTFRDGGTVLGSAMITGTSGVVTFTTNSLAVGSHNITASYAGDANFLGSTSAVVVQVVTAPAVPALPKAGSAALSSSAPVLPGIGGGAALVVLGSALLVWRRMRGGRAR